MSTNPKKEINFGPFEVSDQVHLIKSPVSSSQIPHPNLPQVFYSTSLSFALVNIKPILPGHVLIIPFRPVQRLTELTTPEITDLFTVVQRVQKMLAKIYFVSPNSQDSKNKNEGRIQDGSFNIAVQDGKESGQTVPHVHVHIIPRTKESSGEGDGIYDRLQGEEGNVGGALWDRRAVAIGKFPKIEDVDRKPRSAEDMNAEAGFYREQMELVD